MGRDLSIIAFILSLFMPVVGLILGIVAYSQAKKETDALKGLAIAAIVIGIIWVLMILLGMISFIGFFAPERYYPQQ